jgi:hypothetical protein
MAFQGRRVESDGLPRRAPQKSKSRDQVVAEFVRIRTSLNARPNSHEFSYDFCGYRPGRLALTGLLLLI